MAYRYEVKQMKNIIEEIISIYDKNIHKLELDQLFEYLFFVDLLKLLKSYLDYI